MHIIPAAIAWLFQVEINGSYKQEEKVIHSEISMVKHIFYSIGAFLYFFTSSCVCGKRGLWAMCTNLYLCGLFSFQLKRNSTIPNINL